MRAAGTDAIGMLRWGLRRYSWLFLACLLLGAVIAPMAALSRDTAAEARALVMAERLEVDLEAIPRFGESVFNNGAVTQAIVTEFSNAGDPDDIIPDRVSLIAEQDSIVFAIVGRDPDPDTAAAIANTAAEVFTGALNDAGAGVGEFAIQSEAQPPNDPDTTLGTVFALPVGVVAGAVLGLALVSALLVARRPVVDGADAEELTGVVSLGTVTVPRTRKGRFAGPEQFVGLVPVCRRLLGLPTPTIVLASRRKDEQLRKHLARVLVHVLRLTGDVRFYGPPEIGGTRADHAAPHPAGTRRTGQPEEPRLTVVDGGDLLNLVQPPHSTATVLIVPEGIAAAALRAAVVEHLGGSAEARLLLVKPGHRTRGHAPDGTDVDREGELTTTGAPAT